MSGPRRGFALDLYDHMAGAGNVVVSPASVATALRMVLPGARGATAEEMAAVLEGEPPLDQAVLLGGAGDDVDLLVSNAAWLQRGLEIRQDYLDALTGTFRTSLRQVDFRADPEGARRAINRLVAEQTRGQIGELFPRGGVGTATRLALTNAIYLRARWRDPFDPAATRPEPFHLAGGGTVTAPMMRQERRRAYAAAGGWQAAELPYRGGFVMDVLLPPPPASEHGVHERALDAERLGGLLGALREREVRLTMPRFTFGSGAELRQALATLGMATAFSAAADFSGITPDEPLRIGTVVHEARIEVDERGTTAAAATGVGIRAMAMAVRPRPVELRADRPFLFLVRHQASGQVLFLGRVADPTA